jgi:hypothetical protein
MFVLTAIIDCIFLSFSKILSSACVFPRRTKLITDVAQDGDLPKIALTDNIADTLATYL